MKSDEQTLVNKIGGLAASIFVRTWMNTLDMQGALYDASVDPVQASHEGPVILVFWHEYLLAPFFLRGRSSTAILTSRHRDAEWLSEAARHMGFVTVRGSTNKGGGRALLELMRSEGTCNVGIACDGPQGPRRRMAQGPIYLSSRLQLPLIAFGVGYDRPWRMPTWDRFAIPRAYSRARVLWSPRLQIPRRVRRDSLEHYRRRVERLLLRLTWEAEAWAESGTRKRSQIPMRREAPSLSFSGREGFRVSVRANRLVQPKKAA